MPVTYAIKFRVVPARRDEFLALLCDLLDRMKQEPMYHEATLHRDPGSPNTFLLTETWEDHDDVVNVQLKRPYRQAWHAALPRILEAEREIGIWTPIKADRRPPAGPVPARHPSFRVPSG
jgi:quinol monooxygenase YgiN